MFHTNDRLYNGYVRKNLSTIVSKVKVREIMLHLPCLTSHDRETIEAKRETSGNYNAMVLLLDCLQRRENWPEQFIAALEDCEQPAMAAAIREEYNSLRGVSNPNPRSPAATLVSAHVHPVPSVHDHHQSLPESGGNSHAAVFPPPEASLPPGPPTQALPEPAAHTPPSLKAPVQAESPQASAAQAPKAASPPQPVPGKPQAPEATVATPPSPETYRDPATTPSLPQRRINAQQEPEENLESDGKNGRNRGIPDTASERDGEVSVKIPEPSHPARQDDPSYSDHLQAAAVEDSPSENVQLSQTITMTPTKPPVQDTTPPLDIIAPAVLQPGETSEPAAGLDMQRHPQAETTNRAPLLMMDASCVDDNTVCLSKPGQLISVQPQHHTCPTITLPDAQLNPYSGNSDRLEISNGDSDSGTSVHIFARAAGNPAPLDNIHVPPCQENGVAFEPGRQNQPEENHYESVCQSSLDLEEVRENVVHVVEEPSVLNLDGQASRLQGEAAKETTSAPPSAAAVNLNTRCIDNCHPSDPVPADSKRKLKTLQEAEKTMPPNTKFFFLTAAGVAFCALLLVWRLKK